MGRRRVWLLASWLIWCCPIRAQEDCQLRAAEVWTALQGQRAETAEAHFSQALRKALPPSQLLAIWSAWEIPSSQAATAHSVIAAALPHGLGWAGLPLGAEPSRSILRLDCATTGEVVGLHIVAMPASPASLAANEQIIDIPTPLGPLQGVVTRPRGSGPFPAVLLLAGSGPQDRDERIGPNRPLRDLAQGLAAQGVASLRYDKRSFSYGPRMAVQAITIDDEVTNDALTALRLLRTVPGIDPQAVFVAGHSLGGMMAPRIAQRDPGLAGLILLAAPARSLLAVSAQQVRDLGPGQGMTAAQLATAEQVLAAEQDRLRDAAPGHPLAGTFAGVPQSYWLSLRDYDQLALLPRLRLPTLVLQGGADFQVSPQQDYARWRAALQDRPGHAFHLYPGLNHLFMPAGARASISDYGHPAHIAPQVVVDIANWMRTVTAAAGAARNAGD